MSSDALLTADQIAFMQGPVSIIASSHAADLKPNLVRAHGCTVSGDQRELTIYLAASQAGAVLADVRANRALAVVFCRPTTDQALQVKATDADIIGVQRDGVRITQHYHEMMIAEIAPLGFVPPMLRAMFSVNAADLVAVRCTPTAVFEQTPGPNAGNSIAAAGAAS